MPSTKRSPRQTWLISWASTAAISRIVSRRSSVSVMAIARPLAGADGERTQHRARDHIESWASGEGCPLCQIGEEAFVLLEALRLVRARPIEPHHRARRHLQGERHDDHDSEAGDDQGTCHPENGPARQLLPGRRTPSAAIRPEGHWCWRGAPGRPGAGYEAFRKAWYRSKAQPSEPSHGFPRRLYRSRRELVGRLERLCARRLLLFAAPWCSPLHCTFTMRRRRCPCHSSASRSARHEYPIGHKA